ncbi:MAG: hypothetical protein IRZ32_00150 [Solirubrobacteraceae bacterium]|nr:hypothetical protein [Solirubrobacteraceae bacterium]
MERASLTRLRWRLRGAWQWPLFGVLLVADAALLHELPIAGAGPDWFAAVVLALFFNVVAVAVGGTVGGLVVRRLRPDLPRVVAADRGGTIALAATTALLVAIGIGHRERLAAEREELALQAATVRRWVGHSPAPEVRRHRRHLDRLDTLPFGEDLYRTCVPGDDPERALCLFVDTSQSPPGVRRDPNPAPNSTFRPGP